MFIKNKNSYIIFLIVVFAFTSLSGCAGSGKMSNALKQGGSHYDYLTNFCDKHDLNWEWDGFSNIITVKNLKVSAKLYPGSRLVLYDTQVCDLKSPVIVKQGMIMVPESFSDLFVGKIVVYPQTKLAIGSFSIRKIVIDAGHGDQDPGAIGYNSIQEKEIVLDIARRLKNELILNGIEVILTRENDQFQPLERRSEIANQAKADFFISIHANAAEAKSANGFEAYFLSTTYDNFSKAVQIRENAVIKFEENADYNKAVDLNATLWDMILSENRIESIEMANSIAGQLKKSLKLKIRFVKGAKFLVLKGVRMPAVLLEVGYLTNPEEGAKLNNPYYRQMLAESIAQGILEYKKMFELSDGFSR
ncbi:MAG: N-acetylmuramoyl-L-alanine amidase [Candidatus Omnitrophica bacterium]|nr:N-acetylmuramoyl-L-alanine amidase [Candidatus Omnitrophota bacterium]